MGLRTYKSTPAFDRVRAAHLVAAATAAGLPTGHRRTPQQQAVLDFVPSGSGSLFVEARAGSGKTTIMVDAMDLMRGDVAGLAFNSAIATELARRVRNPRARVATFHSFGLKSLKSAYGPTNIHIGREGEKGRAMCAALGVPIELREAVTKLVSIGKQSAWGVLWACGSDPDERRDEHRDEAHEWIRLAAYYSVLLNVKELPADSEKRDDILLRIVDLAMLGIRWAREKVTTIIDFDDMLWIPLLNSLPIEQFDWVCVDEVQDTNACRRIFARRMMRPHTGRALIVGDPKQAIYGFTGSDADAVERFVRELDASRLPLTVTFRCCKAAVELAQQFVPDIVAHESNPDGEVIDLPYDEFAPYMTNHLPPQSAVLCRYTRPLVQLAHAMIQRQIPCYIEGRDIGKGLVRMATRWAGVGRVDDLLIALERYRAEESQKLILLDAPALIEAINDRVDSLICLADGCDTVAQVVSKIESLFGNHDDKGSESLRAQQIVLCTVHRSKGREWSVVGILGWHEYMPSKMARLDWEREQESNIQYVAVTRAKQRLLLIGAPHKEST